MSETRDNATPVWKQRVRLFAVELREAVNLRRELATLEIEHDRQLLRRGIIVGGIGAIMAVVGLPLLLQGTAQWLATMTRLSVTTWTLIFGTLLLVPGTLLLVRTIRRSRSSFCGLRSTLPELNEDMVWFRD